MQITDSMINKAAKELDRVALVARGWTHAAITEAMARTKPSEISKSQARIVLEAALKTEH